MNETKIGQLRKAKGISQEQLAEILNTTRQAVSKWERGDCYPDIDRLKDLAVFFNVSIDYLLGHDVEAVSVNCFMERLKQGKEEKRFDVSLEEIKLVVSTNGNNFRLLIAVIEYLLSYWQSTPETRVADAVIEYARKELVIFLPDNGVTIDDIHRVIAMGFMMKDDFASAYRYFIDNHVQNAEEMLVECQFELGLDEEASKSASSIFLNAVSSIINGHLVQLRLLLKNNKIDEAHDMAVWTISFLDSISKREDFFLDAKCLGYFVAAICERHLGLNASKSITFVKENYKKVLDIKDDSEGMRFYYNKKVTFLTMLKDLKKYLREKALPSFEGKEIYPDCQAVFKEIFKE